MVADARSTLIDHAVGAGAVLLGFLALVACIALGEPNASASEASDLTATYVLSLLFTEPRKQYSPPPLHSVTGMVLSCGHHALKFAYAGWLLTWKTTLRNYKFLQDVFQRK